MRTDLAAAVCLSCLLSACQPDSFTRVVLASDASDLSFRCDPDDVFPLEVGDFRVQIHAGQLDHLEPSTVEAVLTYTVTNLTPPSPLGHTPRAPVELSLESGAALALGSNEVGIAVGDCDFVAAHLRFLAEVVGRRRDDGRLEVIRLEREFDVVNETPPPMIPSPPQELVEAIVGADVADFARFSRRARTGVAVRNPHPEVDPQVPTEDHTETFEFGSVVVELDQQQLDDAFSGGEPRFPPGEGPLGLTLQSADHVPLAPGRFLLAWQSVVGHIPLDAAGEQQLRYALALDRDVDASNNFRAAPPRDHDQFDDTDTWFVAQFAGGTWSLSRTDAQQLPPQAVPTATRVVFFEQVQLFVIPLAELPAVKAVPGRFTTFAHRGDFGLNEPWSADVTAPVGEPRIVLSLQNGL